MPRDPQTKADARAMAFVEARMNGTGFKDYPGDLPQSLDEAYGVQDEAIAMWTDEQIGWKVGRITGEWETNLGQDRLAGPVFKKQFNEDKGGTHDMPVFADGFAAVEGEVVAVISHDAPEGKTTYTTDEAIALIGAMHVGIEIASSPFAGINDHGPLVTITDFGNNYGLILGEKIDDWENLSLDDWTFATTINNEKVGTATPAGIPGGPVESVRFLLENTARRGLPLKAGMSVLTGAVTGVHQAYSGDTASVIFQNGAPIKCKLSPT